MAGLQIETPEESEHESSFGTIILRVGSTLLCVILGLSLVLFGYLLAIFIDLDLEEFTAYTSIYFSVSLLIWILIGLFAPFALYQRVFEELKGVNYMRVVVFILMIGTFIILHWYIITGITYLLVLIFGTE